MVALAFMSTESSNLIRGANGEKAAGRSRPVHLSRTAGARQEREKDSVFRADDPYHDCTNLTSAEWMCLVFSRGPNREQGPQRMISAKHHPYFVSLSSPKGQRYLVCVISLPLSL